MYYVYRINAVIEGMDREYIGSTTDYNKRMEEHKKSLRFDNATNFRPELLLATSSISECLEREYKEIDIALGGRGKDGNRENFEGSCLNRSTAASLPLSGGYHLCYTRRKGYYIK